MKLIRTISRILIVTVMSMMLQLNVIIVEATDENANIGVDNNVEMFNDDVIEQKIAYSEENYEKVKSIIGEVDEKRERNVKHYMLEDMTYEAVIYDNPVHYLEDGQLKDINNTLVEGTNEVLLEADLQAEVMKQLKESDISTPLDESANSGEDNESNEDDVEIIEQEAQSEEKDVVEDSDVKYEEIENITSDNSEAFNEISQEDILLIKDNKNVLRNVANSFNVELAKKGNSQRLFTISKDKYRLSWNIENSKNVQVLEKKKDVIEINNDIEDRAEEIISSYKLNKKNTKQAEEDKRKIISNEKIKYLDKLTSNVDYINILPNIDLNYSVTSDKIKENIILKQRQENMLFKYNLDIEGVVPVEESNNTILFLDENDESKVVFIINAPYMFDANGKESADINLNLEMNENGKYSILLETNQDWLLCEERVYPVTIDPIVTTNLDANKIIDTFACSIDTDNKWINEYLRVGLVPGNVGEAISFIKFELPKLKSSESIVKAQLSLGLKEGPTQANQINVYKVSEEWNADAYNNVTFANMPDYNNKIVDYAMVYGSWKWVNWDITSIAKDWYNTGDNYGVMLKSQEEGKTNSIFLSSDIYESGNRPQVTMQYINNSGLEDFWTFHSQDAGRAGTGYINDYNGNLIFIHNDISMNGNKMPLTLNHVYNSNQGDELDIGSKPYGYGTGWRLNLSQRIIKEVIGGITYYKYIDGEGTNHYFKYNSSTGKYEDELSKDLTLQLNYDNGYDIGYLIKDKKDNKLAFISSGYLYKIIDSNENTLIMNYQGGILRKITDGAGRVTRLDVGNNGYLNGIIDPSGRRTSYSYNGSQLSSITYPDGKITHFGYDNNNNLTEVKNIDGYKIKYEYYNAKPQRVSKVYEVYKDGSNGQGIELTYGFNTTTFKDYSGVKNIYQFNNFGNTISVRDTDGSAVYYKYGEINNKNKLTLNSKLQKSTLNYLMNHNCEYNNNSWVSKYWTGSVGSSYISQEKSNIGYSSIKVTKTNNISRQFFSQEVTLERGKTYTLSAYISTENITNTNNQGAAIFVNYMRSDGSYETIDSVFINGTTSWSRETVTFTVPSDSASSKVLIRGGIIGEQGIAYFDNIQLEKGESVNRYNLVENSNFANNSIESMDYWSANINAVSDRVVRTDDKDYPEELDVLKSVFSIDGSSSMNKNIRQDIKTSGKKGDVFVVAGWAKGGSVPLINYERYFAIDVGFRLADGTTQWEVISFNEDTSQWQYVSDVVIAKEDYTAIAIYGLYYSNANTVYFDNFQLYKEEFGTSYQYDEDGNIDSTENLAKKSSEFDYDGNNNLIQVTDPKGNNFNYEYDSKHNITKATTAENVVYSFEYDGFGNPKKATIGSSGTLITSTATYSATGNYIDTVTDSNGSVVDYNYNELTGNLEKITDAKGKAVNYIYDVNTDNLKSVSQVNNGITVTNSYTYDDDKLSSISHNGFNYNFIYDVKNNQESVKVGTASLIDNEYDFRNRLIHAIYGNGDKVSYEYDELDRITSKTAKKFSSSGTLIESSTSNYFYDNVGNLAKIEDGRSGINKRYIYDLANRLSKIEDSNGNWFKYEYDDLNKVSKATDNVGGTDYTTAFTYDKDGRTTKVTLPSNKNIELIYDSIGRVTTKKLNLGSKTIDTVYSYKAGTEGLTTTLVSSIKNGTDEIKYTYDMLGRIETITKSGKTTKYYYDDLSQLIREDNEEINKTITYTYDIGGNILSKVEYPYTTANPITVAATSTINYGYTDGAWKDKLTSYNGKTITYDAIGNPLTYDGTTYTWEMGRQLKSINKGTLAVSYKYDDGGIRTEKTVNGLTTSYHLLGDKVTYEETGADKIYYTYDAAGNLVTMTLNGVEYYYLRNGQNDIIGLVDKTGTQVVFYTYDSWGKLISIDGSLKATVGAKNPYRYRGYRYDTETGLYYLNSRYYNPEFCRMLNADDIDVLTRQHEVLGKNLFLYCTNDPVNNSDDNGFWKLPNWAKVTIGVGAIGVAVVATVATGGAAVPALLGALQVAGSSAAIGASIGAVSGYISGGKQGALSGAINGAADGFMWGGVGAATETLAAKVVSKVIFNGNNGYGFKVGKNAEALYKNPNKGGGTLISVKKPKFRVDLDPVDGLHGHWGTGKAAKSIHRSLAPWEFGKSKQFW